MYSINVFGYIPEKKFREFKQNLKQMISQQNSDMIKTSISRDVVIEDLYQVNISFKDKESMFSFIKSEDYAMISGSFKVLGMLKETKVRKCSDLEIKNSDNDN